MHPRKTAPLKTTESMATRKHKRRKNYRLLCFLCLFVIPDSEFHRRPDRQLSRPSYKVQKCLRLTASSILLSGHDNDVRPAPLAVHLWLGVAPGGAAGLHPGRSADLGQPYLSRRVVIRADLSRFIAMAPCDADLHVECLPYCVLSAGSAEFGDDYGGGQPLLRDACQNHA